MPNVLVVGDTVHSTELRHSVPVAIGDPFHYIELDGRRLAVVRSVEGDRISAVDPTIEIVPAETFPLDDLIREGVDAYELQPIQSVRIARASNEIDAAWVLQVHNLRDLQGYVARGEKIPLEARLRVRRDQVIASERATSAPHSHGGSASDPSIEGDAALP